MVETIDTASLKAALIKLAAEEPQFLRSLLAELSIKSADKPQYGIPDAELNQIIEHNFKIYDETFRKLA
ncbi:MAG: hypothetical protein RI894_3 [Bacteroidota bacterium]